MDDSWCDEVGQIVKEELFSDGLEGTDYSDGTQQKLEYRATQWALKNFDRKSCSSVLLLLSKQLYKNYEPDADPVSLRTAIACCRAAVRTTDEGWRHMTIQYNLGPMLRSYYDDCSGQKADLDAIVDVQRAIFDRAQDELDKDMTNLESQQMRWDALNDLIATLDLRYTEWRQKKDVHDALRLVENVESCTVIDPSHRVDILNTFSQLLERRYFMERNDRDLEQAIEVARNAFEVAQNASSACESGLVDNRALLLSNLSRRLLVKFERKRKSSDFDEALEKARASLNLDTKSDHVPAVCLTQLADVLLSRYEICREDQDINEAIQALEKALGPMSNQDKFDQISRLIKTAQAYNSRCRAKQELSDADMAIQFARKADSLAIPESPVRQSVLDILSVSLSVKYNLSPDQPTLDEAIRVVRDVIAVTPQLDNVTLGLRHFMLGELLQNKYEQDGSRSVLDEAICQSRKSINLCPEDDLLHAGVLHSLGLQLVCQFKTTGEKSHLDEAIECFKSASESAQSAGVLGNPFNYSQSYAAALLTRIRDIGASNLDDQATALKIFSKGAVNADAHPVSRIECAQGAISILVNKCDRNEGDRAEAKKFADDALQLAPMVCRRYMSRDDQQRTVKQVTGLAATAASLSLDAGKTEKALEQLELGRGMILGYEMDRQSDLELLRSKEGNLVRRYEALCLQVNADTVKHYRTAPPPVHLAGQWAEGHKQLWKDWKQEIATRLDRQRREALQKMDECVKEIQQVEGYEQFQTPAGIDKLRDLANALAGEGSIVLVNISEVRADAIVLSANEVKAIHLDKVSLKYAPDAILQRATWRHAWRSRGPGSGREFTADEKGHTDKMSDLCTWLWEKCVEPILDELDKMGLGRGPQSDEKPRVWWIGCGIASSLPFHAAGTDFGANSRNNTLSRIVSSYVPTIKALDFARSLAATPFNTKINNSNNILLVTMPSTVGQKDLPGVHQERQAIQKACKESTYAVQELSSPSAAEVLYQLPRCRLAHFACHGWSDPVNPSQSHLMLQRRRDNENASELPDRLTALAIGQSAGEAGEARPWLVFLAACRTAQVQAVAFADEGLHLAGAFQAAGFGHVVAALWAVEDDACALVSGVFYRELITAADKKRKSDGDGGHGRPYAAGRLVAEALQRAVERLRTETECGPETWAPFVHMGA